MKRRIETISTVGQEIELSNQSDFRICRRSHQNAKSWGKEA